MFSVGYFQIYLSLFLLLKKEIGILFFEFSELDKDYFSTDKNKRPF